MSLILQTLKNFPVTIGNLTLYLSGFQMTENSALSESGTADGSTVLSGYWPKGIRLTLKGRIAPAFSAEEILYTLSQNMLTEQILNIRNLQFQKAMLCGYTLSENQDTPELSLIFYSSAKPLLLLEESA